ncbi:MAG: ribonuclease P protein component [Tannerellaceae bacterium]|jgi:ribonuclease P protein component|nr:ribonuclease P protein component [Tannerellaceae bacterium]
MTDKRYTLSKKERLSWKRSIDLLFEKGQSFVAFPLRVIYLSTAEKLPAPVCMMVSVPKRNIKRAVGRNLIKRRIREAYRIHKHDPLEPLNEREKYLMVAFLYLDKEARPFAEIEKAMTKAINRIGQNSML